MNSVPRHLDFSILQAPETQTWHELLGLQLTVDTSASVHSMKECAKHCEMSQIGYGECRGRPPVGAILVQVRGGPVQRRGGCRQPSHAIFG